MADEIIVPAAIEQIIQKYEAATTPFTELDVQQEVAKVRQELGQIEGAENLGAWAEVLAFALVNARTHESPWNSRVVIMTLHRSSCVGSRAQREVTVSEVPLDSDRLILLVH